MSQKSLPATQVQRTRYADRLVTADGSMTGAEVVAAIEETAGDITELTTRVNELENKKVLVVDEFNTTSGVATVSSEEGAKVYAGYYDIILVKNASAAASNTYCAFHKSRVPSSGAVIYVYAYFAKFPWSSSSVDVDTATLYAAGPETTKLSVSYATNVKVPLRTYVDERFDSKLSYKNISDVILSNDMTITYSFYNSFVTDYNSARVIITDATLGLSSVIVLITGTGNTKYGFIDEHTIVKITAVNPEPGSYKLNIALFDVTSISGTKLYLHTFKFKLAWTYAGDDYPSRDVELLFVSNSPTPVTSLTHSDGYAYWLSTSYCFYQYNFVYVRCITTISTLTAASKKSPVDSRGFVTDVFGFFDVMYPGATPSLKSYEEDTIDLNTGKRAARTNLVSNVSITDFSDTVTDF